MAFCFFEPMKGRRFFVAADAIRDGVAKLPPDQSHRLRHVLRLEEGHEIEVFDGMGHSYSGRVHLSGAHTFVTDLSRLTERSENQAPLALAVALIRTARFEWMLEKATELGVNEIVPLVTCFTDSRTAAHAPTERWLKIIRQACEQCGRSAVPAIHQPITFKELLMLDRYSGFARLICCKRAGESLKSIGPVLVCVGPEGGWDAGELELALQSGYVPVTLGGNTLRTETAALAAVSLIRIPAFWQCRAPSLDI